MGDSNFGRLGEPFQMSLIKAIIEDKKFGSTIIEVLEPSYFDGPYFKYIVQHIKELHENFHKIPDYETLAQKIMSESMTDTSSAIHIDTLKNIQDYELKDEGWIKEQSMNFCKQQVLKRELKIVEKIIENGEFQEYKKIEQIIQKALQVGATSEDVRDAFHDIMGTLEKDSRVPIPTGIHGLDNVLKGGLAYGELGVILAPTGIGKSTLITLFANTAFNYDFNVLQIFFEDNMTNILRKHYTIWTGISPDNQPERKEEVFEVVSRKESESKGELKLLKLPSASVTPSDIKSKLRKLISEGFKPDLVLVDYVDCLLMDRSNFGEEWKGEGNIMRHLEAMTSEFDIAMWVATQGNRESISSEIVTTDQMGGSIKKAQIGHVVLSVGKTLEQKEHNLATMTLLKSRIGKDGIVWQNCKFDNEYIVIDTEAQNTLLGHKEEKVQQQADRAHELYRKKQEKKMQEETNKTNKEVK